MSDLIRTEAVSKSIGCVILNRREYRNALSIELLRDLDATLRRLELDTDFGVTRSVADAESLA